MKNARFFARLRAAHSLTIAMADGTRPDPRCLKVLGLSENMTDRFKR